MIVFSLIGINCEHKLTWKRFVGKEINFVIDVEVNGQGWSDADDIFVEGEADQVA
jgi:hypothetical protein